MMERNDTFDKYLNDSYVPSLAEDISILSLVTYLLSIYHPTIMCLVPGTVLGSRETAMKKAKCTHTHTHTPLFPPSLNKSKGASSSSA